MTEAMTGEIPEKVRARATRARRERGVVGTVLTGLLAGLLLLVVALGLAAIVVPAATGSVALTVMTSSMEPSLPPGTLVIVRPTDPHDIEPGAVMTYQLRSGESALVTHRVMQQLQTADGDLLFITQGDNNPGPDLDPIREVQVVGTVWYAIPLVGWIAAGLGGDVRAIIVPILAGALLLYALVMVISGVRERLRRAPEGEA